jgi:complex iron-sulfur molybdoenzyme family reductase subunit gamma
MTTTTSNGTATPTATPTPTPTATPTATATSTATSIVLLGALLAAVMPSFAAADDLPASEVILVADVPGPLAADPVAALWDGIPPTRVPLAPQRTVRLNDRRANAALAAPGPGALDVRAACDGRDLAILVEWPDASEDRARADETDRYGDAAALQFPLRFGAGVRLPYVGMGDEELPVAVHFQRASEGGTAGRDAVAAGFGSLTRADLGGARVAMRHDGVRRAWRAVLVRPLVAGPLDLAKGLVPVAFAVWDGARQERSGNKSLSAWKVLRIARWPAEAAYAAELGWGRRPGDLGDAARGKQLVQGMCAGCHAVGERRAAPPDLAPDLAGIGVVATPAYLRESIVSPSAVVVAGPNPARHQDRAAPRDAHGGYAPAAGFAWWRRDAAGKKVSRMPAYGALPPADLAAMVAYLSTLGADAPAAGSQR